MQYNNEILERLKSRDKYTIELIYKCLFPRIYGWIILNSGSKEDAEDIFHDSLLCIIMKLESIQLTCDFSTFFISVCRNKWLQVLYKRRKNSRMVMDKNLELCEDINDQMEAEEKENRKYQIFLDALHHLDAKSQAVIEATLNGKSNEDIAIELGFINTQAVADKKKNCKKKLISILCNCIEYKELMNEVFEIH